MAETRVRAFCRECRRMVLSTKPRTSLVFHLLLTLCTGGLWMLAWFPLEVATALRAFRCPNCGSRVSHWRRH